MYLVLQNTVLTPTLAFVYNYNTTGVVQAINAHYSGVVSTGSGGSGASGALKNTAGMNCLDVSGLLDEGLGVSGVYVYNSSNFVIDGLQIVGCGGLPPNEMGGITIDGPGSMSSDSFIHRHVLSVLSTVYCVLCT